MTLIDFDAHYGIADYRDLFPHMSLSWQKHFSRDEWLGSVALSVDHIRVSDRFRHDGAVTLAAPRGRESCSPTRPSPSTAGPIEWRPGPSSRP